ncbi:MAG: glycosyltransferase [Candidatus Omnitrophica bacterium]|nr:glycosyltransferase [Candidatus Omnitrophota bacterium]
MKGQSLKAAKVQFMKIAVYLADQNPHRDRTLGITNYTRCLLSGLLQRTDIYLSTLVSASSFSLVNNTVEETRLPWRTDNPFFRLLTDNLSAPILDSMKPDVVYYPKGYVSYIMRPRCPVVGTVHDTILQYYADHYPHARSPIDLVYWIGLMKSSIRKFDMILADSCSTRDQILEFCRRYRIAPPPIRVTYAASDYEDVQIRQNVKKDYILHFASLSPHKNTKALMEVWSHVSQERPSWPQLKLIGSTSAVAEFLEYPGVSHIPFIENHEFSAIIEQARAILIPSAIEGFGLPALEGYYHGTPVCFLRGTSVEEILCPFTAKGGFLLDDPQSFKQALDQVLGMSFEEVVKIRDGLRAKFSKNNFVEAVAGALCDAGSKTGMVR